MSRDLHMASLKVSRLLSLFPHNSAVPAVIGFQANRVKTHSGKLILR